MSPDAAAARGGGPQRRAAPGVAAEAAGAGPGHLQVHQHLRDPRVLHPAGGGQRRLRPHADMSRNVKHLKCGGQSEGGHLKATLPQKRLAGGEKKTRNRRRRSWAGCSGAESHLKDFKCFQSVHTLCTDCALNFLTYFIHKNVHLYIAM